eukprot:scaffold1947_cov207-Prasinococcus_capsulatus_cf.AAC.23
MAFSHLLLLLAGAGSVSVIRGNIVEKVVNGHQADFGSDCEGSDPFCGPRVVARDYSFFSSLRMNWGQKNAYCGASLIHPKVRASSRTRCSSWRDSMLLQLLLTVDVGGLQFVVTAAHCEPSVGDLVSVGWYYSDYSKNVKGGYGHQTTIKKVECYGGANHYDLCVIELKEKTPKHFTVGDDKYEVKPVKLNFDPSSWLEAPFEQDGATLHNATVIGIGLQEADSMFVPSTLMTVHVPVIPYECCSFPYYKYPASNLDKTMFCAGGWNGEKKAGDACQGDSGGPIVTFVKCDESGEEVCPVQIGVVSWGNGCGWIAVGYPGVYGRMSMFKNSILGFTGLKESDLTLPTEVVKLYANSDYNYNRKCPASMQGAIEVRSLDPALEDVAHTLTVAGYQMDGAFSCDGKCNDNAGPCKCDNYGDCCNDYNEACASALINLNSCKAIGCGNAGEMSQAMCNCDPYCTYFYDCCEDFQTACYGEELKSLHLKPAAKRSLSHPLARRAQIAVMEAKARS